MGATTVPASGSGGLSPYRQVFTSSGTWTKPAGVKTATVTCIGGGGGAYPAAGGIPGGGGGGYIKTIVDVTSIASATITVGAGGVTSTTVANITSGSASSFGDIVTAYGGEGRIKAYENLYVSAGIAVAQDSGASENTQNAADGLTAGKWVVRNTSGRTVGNNWLANDFSQTSGQPLAYNGTNLYLSTAATSNELWTSSNAITWTKITPTVGTIYNVGWNGTYFVIVPNATGTTAYYGTNGTTWTTAALPTSQTWAGCVTSGTLSVAYASASSTAAYSTNGTTWTGVTLPAAMNGVYMYVANGRIYYTSSTGALYYTTNGATWTAAGNVSVNAPITYNASTGVYLAHNYTAYAGVMGYHTSTDGVTWTSRSYASVLTNPYWNATTINTVGNPTVVDDRWFIFAGIQGQLGRLTTQQLWSSTDGATWTLVKNWNKGVTVTTGTDNYPFFYIPTVSIGSGRFIVYMGDRGAGSWNVSALYMSKFLTGGMQGQMVISWSNSSPNNSAGGGSAGASESKGMPYIGFNAANAPNTLVYRGGAGIDGYCKGGEGYATIDGSNQSYLATIGSVNYGDGANAINGGGNGGNGLVIVEWWA